MGAHRYEAWVAPLPCQSGSGLHPWEAPSGGERRGRGRSRTDSLEEHRHTRCPLLLWTISPSRRLGLAELSAAVGADSSSLASQHYTRPTQARIVVSPIAGSGSPPAWARRCCCRCFAQLRCVFEFPILILAIVQWHGRSAVVRLATVAASGAQR